MLGKVTQLRGKQKDGFEVVYGIDDHVIDGRYLLSFAEIVLGDNNTNSTTTYIYGGHLVEEKGDGYKKVLIFNKELPKNAKEEYLLVIVPYAAQLVTTGKRIAGRYYYEGIFEMHEGEKIEVSKDFSGKRDVYIVAQAENELFLIKKER